MSNPIVDVRLLQARYEAIIAELGKERMRNGGFEPPGGDKLEARVAKLESHMEYVRRDLDVIVLDLREHRKETRSDFRILFGALITTALGLAALMAKGFHWF